MNAIQSMDTFVIVAYNFSTMQPLALHFFVFALADLAPRQLCAC